MKKMTLPVAVTVAIVGCVLAVSANVTTSKIHEDLTQERYKRITAEQQLQKVLNEIKGLQSELTDSRSKLDNIQAIVNDGQAASVDLQSQLDAVMRERDILKAQMDQVQKPKLPQAAPAKP